MAVTSIRSLQLKDGAGVNIDDLDITTSGKSVIAKLAVGNGLTISSSTGADSGTGVVTVKVSDALSLVTSLTSPIVYGSASSGGTLTLYSTSHATKGKILFGASAYDEVNDNLLINQTTVYTTKHRIDVYGTTTQTSIRLRTEATGAALGGGILLYHNNASAALPSADDRLGYFLAGTLDGTTPRNCGGITIYADGAWSSTSLPTRFHFEVAPAGSTTRAKVLTIDSNGNIGILATAFGTSAANVLGIKNGTEPSSSPADMVQLFSVDLSAGNATLGIRTETAVVTESVTSDRTLSVRINGVTYKICLKS